MSNDTQTLTLTDFLLARIAEDEAVARSSPDVERKSDAAVFTSLREPTGTVEFDPARVLAECEAKRRIVEEHPIYQGPRILEVDSTGTDFGCELCHCVDPVHADGIIESLGYCTTLRSVASVYADHPDYREEWQ